MIFAIRYMEVDWSLVQKFNERKVILQHAVQPFRRQDLWSNETVSSRSASENRPMKTTTIITTMRQRIRRFVRFIKKLYVKDKYKI